MVLIQPSPVPSAFLNTCPQILSENNAFDFFAMSPASIKEHLNVHAIFASERSVLWLLNKIKEFFSRFWSTATLKFSLDN